MTYKTQVYIASGINLLAGLWLIIAPFFYDFAIMGQNFMGQTPNALATGIFMVFGFVIAVLAIVRLANAYRLSGFQRSTIWLSWINVLIGIWLIIAPFVLGYNTFTVALWNSIIVGVIVAAFGAWSVLTAEAAGV